jgi:hypothetical protein
VARNDCFCKHTFKDSKSIRNQLAEERKAHSAQLSESLAKEAGIPSDLFMAKTKEFRRKHDQVIAAEQMINSDECDEEDNFSDKERDLFNSKVLGYQKDYLDTIEDIEHEK